MNKMSHIKIDPLPCQGINKRGNVSFPSFKFSSIAIVIELIEGATRHRGWYSIASPPVLSTCKRTACDGDVGGSRVIDTRLDGA